MGHTMQEQLTTGWATASVHRLTPIAAVLARKGPHVFSVSRTTRVIEAVRLMEVLEIDSVLVVDGRHVIGILTGRDILRRVVAERESPDTVQVDRVMTTELMTIPAHTAVTEAMAIMTRARRRHLPVCSDDATEIIGLISIGDVMNWLLRDSESLIDDLVGYITRP